jgi:hypothetical protein
MKKLFLKYWWSLPLLMVVLMLTLLLLFTTVPTFFESVVGILLVLTLVAIIASWIVLGIHRQWWKCLASIVSSILSFLCLGSMLVMFSLSSPDGFARKHPISEGLAYHIPLEENAEGPVVTDSLDTENFLQIWNDFQGGIYRYDFYYPALPAGEIFLRCYEATKNEPLSEDRLPARSIVQIDSTFSSSKLVDKKEFTIYEGDWGEYYAARSEVWYREGSIGPERKLMEKVYRVEGWMR